MITGPLDGVLEDPGGSEGFKYGGWSFEVNRGEEGDKFKLDEVLEAEAQLLGRVTYEGFAAAWPSITDEVGFAEKMNSMPSTSSPRRWRSPRGTTRPCSGVTSWRRSRS
jgi:hypothetical protein